jgi:glycosyltransferase involved in cell wall biosynthesis
LFYGALASHGIRQVPGLSVNDVELDRLRPEIDAIHFHWPEYAWRLDSARLFGQWRGVIGFARFLRHARTLGLRVIWTAHNLRAHESTWTDMVGLTALARASDMVIVHGALAARQVRTPGRIVTMPHGNYDGVYPVPLSRDETLTALGLKPGLPTLALVGALRPYKGIDHAIEAVAALGGRVQLVVAGTPKPGFDLRTLLATASRTKWLGVLAQPLSDQEFANIVNAADGVVLPYTRLTTSGVLLAAWTLGRGVITSREPYFTDMLTAHPNAGHLTTGLDAAALARAIVAYFEMPLAVRSVAARTAADAYAWDECVLPVVDALRGL